MGSRGTGWPSLLAPIQWAAGCNVIKLCLTHYSVTCDSKGFELSHNATASHATVLDKPACLHHPSVDTNRLAPNDPEYVHSSFTAKVEMKCRTTRRVYFWQSRAVDGS